MIVSDTDLPVADIVKGYKDLWRIERSFRTMKSFLDIRPVYHRKDGRIRAHVFLCVLSLLISRLFEKAVNDAMTIGRISETISKLEVMPIRTENGTLFLRTVSEEAKDYMEKMSIPYPKKVLGYVVT